MVVKVREPDQEEKECHFLLPASLTVEPNIRRHQTPAVLSLLTNSLVKRLALVVAHFSSLFPETSLSVVVSSQFHHQ